MILEGRDIVPICIGEYNGPKSIRMFIRYSLARLQRENELISYMAYMTDQMMLLGQGKTRSDRWIESIIPKLKDERTAEDIILDVKRRMGREVNDEPSRPDGENRG